MQPAWHTSCAWGRPETSSCPTSLPELLPSCVTTLEEESPRVGAADGPAGAVPAVSAVPFSLSAVRSRVPEAEGEELPVSLWAALHGDAHQGESSAVVWGCF